MFPSATLHPHSRHCSGPQSSPVPLGMRPPLPASAGGTDDPAVTNAKAVASAFWATQPLASALGAALCGPSLTFPPTRAAVASWATQVPAHQGPGGQRAEFPLGGQKGLTAGGQGLAPLQWQVGPGPQGSTSKEGRGTLEGRLREKGPGPASEWVLGRGQEEPRNLQSEP